MECFDCALQSVHAVDERADDGPFGTEFFIAAREVILDQAADIAVVEPIGQVLPRREVDARLIETATEPLAILRDEAGYEPPGR